MREPRVVATFNVAYERLGKRVVVQSEDVSRRGLFLRTIDFLPVGDVLELEIKVGGGDLAVTVVSRVAHVLSEPAARSLGREPGMGFEFLEEDRARLYKLHLCLDRLLEGAQPLPEPVAGIRVVVADSSTRLLERISTALGHAGMKVRLVPNGAEAYAICLDEAPDVVLTTDEMPMMDGWTLIRRLQAHPGLADIPVIMMSVNMSDLARLKAYRAGVTQFVRKPFTDEEIMLRIATAVRSRRRTAEHVILRGRVAEVGIATLLTLLDFERKSGMLILIDSGQVATVFIAQGRIVKIEPVPAGMRPRDRLLELLDWRKGTFEFIMSEVVGSDEISLSTPQVLLEHARLRDEAARDAKVAAAAPPEPEPPRPAAKKKKKRKATEGDSLP